MSLVSLLEGKNIMTDSFEVTSVDWVYSDPPRVSSTFYNHWVGDILTDYNWNSVGYTPYSLYEYYNISHPTWGTSVWTRDYDIAAYWKIPYGTLPSNAKLLPAAPPPIPYASSIDIAITPDQYKSSGTYFATIIVTGENIGTLVVKDITTGLELSRKSTYPGTWLVYFNLSAGTHTICADVI